MSTAAAKPDTRSYDRIATLEASSPAPRLNDRVVAAPITAFEHDQRSKVSRKGPVLGRS
jgi:hypothetical protein